MNRDSKLIKQIQFEIKQMSNNKDHPIDESNWKPSFIRLVNYNLLSIDYFCHQSELSKIRSFQNYLMIKSISYVIAISIMLLNILIWLQWFFNQPHSL